MASFDYIIRGGEIIDGASLQSVRYRADLAVSQDRITAIGDLSEAAAQEEIDASGKVVAPGLIDVHNHSDGWMIRTPHLACKTLQGFTTEILMADGISYAPVNRDTARSWIYYLKALNGLPMEAYQGWESIEDYMQQIDGANVQNAATHVPYANVRSLVCGFGPQAVNDYQRSCIQGLIREGMQQGAVGLSTGLDYISQCFCTTQDLIDACKAIRDNGGVYVTHIRYKQDILPALEEAVEIGRRADVPVHISHLKGRDAAHTLEILEFVEKVRREVQFSYDIYPYQPASTMLNYLLPYEAWEDGPLAVLAKLNDSVFRSRLKLAMQTAFRLPLDRLRIAWTATREGVEHQGKTLLEYVEETGLPAEDALCDFLIEQNLAVLLVLEDGDDAWMQPMVSHECGMLGTDGIYFPDGRVHPRVYGSAGRWIGECVRNGAMTLEHAVYKASGFAAEKFGLRDRGELREGAFADVMVFDAETVGDPSTYENPHQFTVGVEWVLVNGVPVIRDGEPAEMQGDRLPGRYLRRSV